jgi:RNA polymerase sigma-70 factor, ECF subfamily
VNPEATRFIHCNIVAMYRIQEQHLLDVQDAALVDQTLKGDESAFAELVRRYQAAVWRTVWRTLGNSTDSEDAVQEVFLRVYTALGRFDRSYPFGPWILRIAANYCIDQLRRRKRVRYRLWTELSDLEQERALRDLSHEGDFGSLLDQGPEKYEKVAAGLVENLKPKYRMAFVLREVEKRSYEEIAGLLGTSQLTVRVRVSRARAEIRRKFEAFLAEKSSGCNR